MDFKKRVLEVEISDDVLTAAETKWGWRYKVLISQLTNATLLEKLELEKGDIAYMREFKDKLEKSIVENGISDESEICGFGYRSISTLFALDLPYNPEINIEITISDKVCYIRFNTKPTSRAFKDYLSIALDKINGINNIKKLYVSVAEIEVHLMGGKENIINDVNDVVSNIKKTLELIYNTLCEEVYKKDPKILFQ